MKLNFENYPQRPHSGILVNQVVPEEKRAAEIERARSLPSIRVDLEAVITIEMITTGVLSPNRGFMNEADYLSTLDTGRLANGVVWPVPLSFAPAGKRNGEIIKSLFSYYLKYTHLGGKEREAPLDPDTLTLDDLEAINRDIRENASHIYDQVFRKYSFLLDHNRDVQRSWITQTRERLHKLQNDLIADLEQKVEHATATVSDEFMYQDRAERELTAAQRLLGDIPSSLPDEHYQGRIWNPARYERYLGTACEDN